VEKDYGGFIHSTRRENLEYWDRVSLQWNLQCTGGLRRFWARRARTSIDVLGLGVTSRQGGWFWGVLKRSIRFKLRKQHQIQAKEAASDSG
jgi:hypothetical protein